MNAITLDRAWSDLEDPLYRIRGLVRVLYLLSEADTEVSPEALAALAGAMDDQVTAINEVHKALGDVVVARVPPSGNRKT